MASKVVKVIIIVGFLSLVLGGCAQGSSSYSTLTPLPTPSFTQTPIPTIVKTATPTIKPTPFPRDEIISPDGKFVAKLFSEYQHPSGKEAIEIWKSDGSAIWVVPYQGEMPTYDPRPSLSLYRWASDSSVFYLFIVCK